MKAHGKLDRFLSFWVILFMVFHEKHKYNRAERQWRRMHARQNIQTRRRY